MSNNEQPVNADTNVNSPDDSKPRIRVKRLKAEESKEHSEKMGLPTSYLIIGNTIKVGRK